MSQANVVKTVMERFCASSGAKVSLDKSSMFVSPQALASNTRLVSQCLGISLTKDFWKYLGVPLIHSRVVRSTYRELIDKVSSRLSGSKTKCLNLAGRATLVASVTSAIPTYTMLTTRLPKNVCSQLDSMNRGSLSLVLIIGTHPWGALYP